MPAVHPLLARIHVHKHQTGHISASQLCSHCTAPLPLVPLPCAACPLALFCGARCRAAAAHRPGGCECGVPWTLLLPQDAVLASRIVRGMQTQVVSYFVWIQAAPKSCLHSAASA